MDKDTLVRKIELVVFYTIMMIIGYSFKPPLAYTQYAMEMGVILALAIMWDVLEDWAMVMGWVKY